MSIATAVVWIRDARRRECAGACNGSNKGVLLMPPRLEKQEESTAVREAQAQALTEEQIQHVCNTRAPNVAQP